MRNGDLKKGMDIDKNFPTKLQAVDDVPEPLRRALKARISPSQQVCGIIHSPAFLAVDDLPATALVVQKDGWLVATEDEGGVSIQQSTFDETLSLELSSILLSGELKIFFVSVGRRCVATIPFNSVREDLYREAVNLILDGIDASPSFETLAGDRPQPLLDAWPTKFRSEAEQYRPASQTLVAATRWDAVTSGFERDLSPAGALLVTARTMLSIVDQQLAVQARRGCIEKFGGITAYFPIARLSDFQISHHGRFGVLTLRLRAPHGHEQLELLFPSQREKAVTKTVAWAFLNNREV
jgi:hypothetical protein